jgi:hypothetical protein
MTKIYLVTNCYGDPNKVYIGKTKVCRKQPHKKTYGKQIEYTYIDEVDSLDRQHWKPLESYWIEQFRQWGFDIQNKNKGGGGLEFHTEETKQYFSSTRKGKPKPSTSKAHKGRTSPNKGKGKKILQYDLTGKFISEWNNINEAIITLGLTVNNESIRQCLKGKAKKSSDYIWRYYINDYPIQLDYDEVEYILKNTQGPKGQKLNTGSKISKALTGRHLSSQHIKKISKPVAQYDKQGNYITQYNSITEASSSTNAWNITSCCKGYKKTSGGYIWRYI